MVQVVFTLKEAWKGFGAGAVISYDLAELKRDVAAAKPQLVFQPGPRDAVQAVDSTKDRLAIVLLEDVKGAVDVYDHKGRRLAWTSLAVTQERQSERGVGVRRRQSVVHHCGGLPSIPPRCG